MFDDKKPKHAMPFSKLKIGGLASGGIITNYFCTSACRHCLYNCSPRWEKNHISVEIAAENFRDLFGSYIPGLCSGLAIAREDLGRALPEEKYPLLTRLCSKGIRGLYEMAIADFGFTPSREGYINQCDLCTEIRHFLFDKGFNGSRELSPCDFYISDRGVPHTGQ